MTDLSFSRATEYLSKSLAVFIVQNESNVSHWASELLLKLGMKIQHLISLFVGLLAPLSLTAQTAQPISITLSVDWEGRELNETNLQAMRAFRDDFPHVKLVHFLNAAYFTKVDANRDLVRQKIQSVLRPGDELGLHIHGWKNLFEAAGVPFRINPTFWGRPVALPSDSADVGHDVMISIYTVEELRKVINYSVRILNENGFNDLKSFRAGGWVGAPNVLEALVREGFTSDSSAVPSIHLKERLGSLPLYTAVTDLWTDISIYSRPFIIHTPAGPIHEFPNTAGLADYVTGAQVFDIFMHQQNSKTPTYLHYGFHQETAAQYLPQVRESLRRLNRFAGLTRRPMSSEDLNPEGRSFIKMCTQAL